MALVCVWSDKREVKSQLPVLKEKQQWSSEAPPTEARGENRGWSGPGDSAKLLCLLWNQDTRQLVSHGNCEWQLFLLCFHKCRNKNVKCFWIAQLFLPNFCFPTLFYRTKRSLWVFPFSWKSCWERNSHYKAKELAVYTAKLYWNCKYIPS